ncbi:hypothetical protein AAVH_26441 [Aphelenchoides avenae]|nr:hypothetical protein AAVH_26441 [Aphelenchus avenae]
MNFARGMKALHELVSERIEREAAAMKAYYNQQHGVEKTSFQVSDRVFFYNPNIAVDRHSTKLTPQWEGPFRVLELSENSALVSYEIDGTLLDFSSVCPAHKSLKLSSVTSSMPSCAVLWTAKNVYDLAQGVQVAESLQLSPASRALFFANNSPLASTDSFAKPTEDTLVRVMAKLVSSCKERQSAFAATAFKKLTCSSTARQPDLKLIVAERTRAELDDKKSLRSDPVIVLGGHNAQVLSDVLGAVFVEASTVPDLRMFFESTHFQAAVQSVFVWLDIDDEHFKLAHQPQLVPALRDIVVAAAKWGHVQFVVLPVPYAASLLPIFDSFMHEFNQIICNLPNVFWLNDAERLDGARLAHSLGSNALVTNFTCVDKTGRISRRSARAALRFIRQLHPSLVPEHVNLSDSSPQQPIRRGNIQKPHRGSQSHREDNTSRGAPNKRGGGGSRGHSFDKRQGHGSRRN